MNEKYYIYVDQDGQYYKSKLHFLSAKELCILLKIYTKDKNGVIHYPTRKLQTYLQNKVPSYFYRPNLNSTYNQKRVYDIYSVPNISNLMLNFLYNWRR